MDSVVREASLTAPERDADESRSLMALLPPETKTQIMSYISTQQSLSRLSQSCRAWYGPATQELYTRDAKKHTSFAIKWMAAHAVDEHTTASALRTLEISRRWGGQIDAVLPSLVNETPWNTVIRISQSDKVMYETSTALHFAVILGNMRLVETLLDMKASLAITCRNRLWKTMGSEEVLRRASYFQSFFSDRTTIFGEVFPIFLAFLKSDPHMCKLLVEHGAGRKAKMVHIRYGSDSGWKALSILHFAAADPTKDYRQWQCLFDSFRDYIDEPCPARDDYTPLHFALWSGCTQGMQIAVESGADKEARGDHSRTPLSVGVEGIAYYEDSDLATFDERTMCFRKFVELGANVNPEGESLLVLAVEAYAPNPVNQPKMRELIYFLLDHHADVNGTGRWDSSNVFNAIVCACTSSHYNYEDPLVGELLKELLSDLANRGLNLTIPAPGLASPESTLYRVLYREAKPEWLFDLLCEKGATVHDNEVDKAFIHWCMLPRLWRTNKYNVWWQHQGQEDEIFQKWCEHPYNAWWRQHAKRISAYAAKHAYGVALNYEYRNLYDTLTHLPLPAPSDGSLVRQAFKSKKPWSWRLVVHEKIEDKSLATLSFDKGDNMIHLTVRKYIAQPCYPTIDAVQAVLHLRNKGVNMSSPNSHGQTPLDLLLRLGSCHPEVLELVALLEGKMDTQGVLETTTFELQKMTLF